MSLPFYKDPWLWAAVAAGLLLRLWGLAYGLPHVYNPDEVSIMSRALALANSGLNPGNFLYPSFYFYVLAGAIGCLGAVQVAFGVHPSLAAFEAAFWQDPSAVYLAGRGLSVAAGTLTVATTYALGARVGSTWTARAAALLYAVSYIPVRDAHFIKHDVPTALAVTVVALAAHRLWQHGRARDVVLAGAAAGAAFATHYYAAFSTVIVATALGLRIRDERAAADGPSRTGGVGSLATGLLADGRSWRAAATFAVVFAALSPYVLIDWHTAWRDIAANRAILVDRTRETFGTFGALDEHLQLLAFQGLGPLFAVGAVVGAASMVRHRPSTALWLFAFPVVFLAFLANTWPFGRTGNVLYPFLAVACAHGVEQLRERVGRRDPQRLPAIASFGPTLALGLCAVLPLRSSLIMDSLMSREDTRTRALRWIEAQVADGARIAVEPYSVPLTQSRDWLAETVVTTRGSVERAGYRVRTQLSRSPYPAPAYRVLYIGEGGLDEDKRYVEPSRLANVQELAALRAQGLEYVVLKQVSTLESNALRDTVSRAATLVYSDEPFGADGGTEAQLPDYDIPPSRDVERPGPILEVWRLR